ncbi:MAG: hypothetical protein AAF984_07030 [Verrucomicrobiota bacterium]
MPSKSSKTYPTLGLLAGTFGLLGIFALCLPIITLVWSGILGIVALIMAAASPSPKSNLETKPLVHGSIILGVMNLFIALVALIILLLVLMGISFFDSLESIPQGDWSFEWSTV